MIPVLGSFRGRPQTVYGRPDWDLIFRVFYDFGRVVQSDRLDFERNDTLNGIGAGAELVIRENLRVRFDWGYALNGVGGDDDKRVRGGSSEYHLLFSLLY